MAAHGKDGSKPGTYKGKYLGENVGETVLFKLENNYSTRSYI